MIQRVFAEVVLVVGILCLLSAIFMIGRTRLTVPRSEYRERLRMAAPVTTVLVGILLFNSVARRVAPDLSWLLGYDVTWRIYALEGQLIIWLQSFAHPVATAYFSFVYVYGYVFLLVFPIIAYLALADTRPLRELLTAYSLNYAFGLVLYVIFIAYGPRNLQPELVDGLLYDAYPRFQHLTRQVNRNTNVFPSLHTSLSVTVALFAYQTRDIYRSWYILAVVLATSIAISTMYLGIHWAVDVVAGIVLAWVSVRLSAILVGRYSVSEFAARIPVVGDLLARLQSRHRR